MTTPRPSPGVQESTAPTTLAATQNNENASSNEDKWLVKTPTFVSSFKVDGVSEVITPKGVELTKDEVTLAKAAAKKVRYNLNTTKVSKEASN